jgi:hypothetical protein
MLDYPNEIASVRIGKNGNAIYGLNEMGKMASVKMRVIRGSADDKFLLSLLTQQQANFAGTVLAIGTFTKLLGDGKGNIANDTYIMAGGVFKKQVAAKTNVEGDSQQSEAEYEIDFSSAIRALT